jgi:hypothetical protein
MLKYLLIGAFVVAALGMRIGAAIAQGTPAAPSNTGDAFAYCARIGTIDTPSGDFAPSVVPRSLGPRVRPALGLSADATLPPGGVYWRCMDHAVYVCAVGANIPCDAKADRAKRNPGAENFCRANPDATEVPAAATGHATIYDWRCSAGHAARGKQIFKLDRRGYSVDFWHRVSSS